MAVSELTSPAPAYTHTTTHLRSSSQLSLSFTHLSLRFPRAFRPRSTTMTCSVNQVQAPVSVQNQEPKDKSDCFGEEGTKSWKKLINVAVSGAAGMISNHLLFKLASGEVFGPDQPIALKLLGSERSFQALEGVAMEVEDSLYPLLREVSIGINPHEVFEDPQGPGMERADLLDINGQIFAEQSLLLNYSLGSKCNAVASCNVKVIVVGNPCNALICLKNAPNIPAKNFHALTMLDENRLALKADVFYDKVSNMTIDPDFLNARINGLPVKEVIKDHKWLEEEFTEGSECGLLIQKWGRSSAASMAVSIVDAIKSLITPTPEGLVFFWISLLQTEAKLLAEKSCVAHLIGEGVGFCDQITEDTMLPGET
ncbi:hypothetical protein P3X46_014527 [Hevea brasiliensis]|uniref:Malate dehydrogenase n=1 Tax=Hevea brasiliensis TaxID=3981 RepID=A0ABQ9M990_HEVBR|nr:hypothetical protein P3X46_014527 [Hevea brasiliensis]